MQYVRYVRIISGFSSFSSWRVLAVVLLDEGQAMEVNFKCRYLDTSSRSSPLEDIYSSIAKGTL